MTTVGYGDKAPRTGGGRTVALFWMFASLLMVSGFTAAIASALTVGALDSPIQGPEDLVRVRVATVGGSSSADWLREHSVSFTAGADIDQALGLLEAKRADAVVYDLPILSYLARQHPEGSIVAQPRIFELQPYALALPAGSPLIEQLNQDILEITGDDDWHRRVLDLVGMTR